MSRLALLLIGLAACKRTAPAPAPRADDARPVDAAPAIDAPSVDAPDPIALCRVLEQAIADAPDDFAHLTTERVPDDENNVYESTLALPGAEIRVTLPGLARVQITYAQLDRPVFDAAAADLARCGCLRGWTREDKHEHGADWIFYRRRATPDDGLDLYLQLDSIGMVTIALRP